MPLIQLRTRRVDADGADAKLERLRARLRELGALVIGYSGGVDSAFLVRVAQQELGERAVAVVALSESYPERERDAALALAAELGLTVETVATREIDNPAYAANPTNRCYFCKEELFVHLRQVADARGIAHIAFGAIADDLGDHRPGAVAAREYGALAPLQEVGLWKDEIRHLSRALDLPTWDKPSLACLSSRIPYGTPVTPELLRRLEAAEDFLRDLGLRQLRVRHHDTIARLEVDPAEFPVALAHADAIAERLKALGWTYVALDLSGYRTGSMNAHLTEAERGHGAA